MLVVGYHGKGELLLELGRAALRNGVGELIRVTYHMHIKYCASHNALISTSQHN
jgi:hypothetical protein